jgi:bacteriocin biosynthesis cyclodehydratase domain-containing protein
MIVRLNPDIPLVWRSPDTLQAGVDRPLAVIPGMTAALERVVYALRCGIPEEGARRLAEDSGAPRDAVDALVETLRPAFLGARMPGTLPGVVLFDGDGPTTERMLRLMTELGIRPCPPDGEPALAVIVTHYATEPERHGRWLRRDIPHLPVVYGDAEVRIGPLVEPGTGPCLSCLEHHRIDADPAWAAIAIQLLHRRAATETDRNSIIVAAFVTAAVDAFLRTGANPLSAASLVVDAASGALSRRDHLPHAGCGCRALPGTVTVLAGNAAARRTPPSSSKADDVPA